MPHTRQQLLVGAGSAVALPTLAGAARVFGPTNMPTILSKAPMDLSRELPRSVPTGMTFRSRSLRGRRLLRVHTVTDRVFSELMVGLGAIGFERGDGLFVPSPNVGPQPQGSRLTQSLGQCIDPIMCEGFGSDWGSSFSFVTNTAPYANIPSSQSLDNVWDGIDVAALPDFNLYANPGRPPFTRNPATTCRGEAAVIFGTGAAMASQLVNHASQYGAAAAAIASRYVGASVAWVVIWMLEVAAAMTPAGWLSLAAAVGLSLGAWWLWQECMDYS